MSYPNDKRSYPNDKSNQGRTYTRAEGGHSPPPPPQIKKKTSIKKLRFAHKKNIYVSPPLKYLDIDLQENK